MDWNGFFACGMSAVFVVGVFGTVVLLRWFRHREIVTLAEKGLLPAQYAQLRASRDRGALGWGIALAALGLALVIGMWPIGFVVEEPYPLHFGPWMLVGLIPLFIGLGLLIVYFVTRKENGATPEEKAETPSN
jgi:hypothetical protein